MQHLNGHVIASPTLDSNATLADRRDETFDVQLLVDSVGHTEYLERSARHDNRSTLGHFVQPGVNVAA